MNREDYEKLTTEQAIDLVLKDYGADLDEECYCRIIQKNGEREKYTITVDLYHIVFSSAEFKFSVCIPNGIISA